MADHLTEEEQIEAIKRWWQDNWLSVVLPVLLIVFAYTGWNYWNDYKAKRAEEASDKYERMLSDIERGALDDQQKQTVLAMATDISSEYQGTFYADASSFLLAKDAVEAGDFNKAEALLRAEIDKPSNEALALVAKARLARVLVAADKADEALTLVSGEIPDAARAMYAELRGDIYSAQAQAEAASTAYQEAIESLDPSQMTRFGILQLKISSLKTAANSDESTADAETGEQG